MKTTNLTELLSPPELSHIKVLLQTNNEIGLREYLNVAERKETLEKKGVLADYLYYVITYNKNNILKMTI